MTKCYICDKEHKASDMKCCVCNAVHVHQDHLYVDGCSSCMGKVEWCSECDKDDDNHKHLTKDELTIIAYCLSPGTYDSWEWPEEHRMLKLKIQSMIDNYCTHEEDQDVFMRVLQCANKNCNEILGVMA